MKVGDRCRIGEEFFANNKHNQRRETNYRERRGKIIGESLDRTAWSVLWDGYKTTDSWHKSFVVEVETGT